MGADKHAFLIMARSNSNQLEKLVKSLDYFNNDIYVHIDKKNKKSEKVNVENICRYARLTIIDSINVNWAAYSQVQAELNLLKSAVESNNKYVYIHLISESDLLIKSNTELHRFFRTQNSEFLKISDINNKRTEEKIRYYYPLQEFIGKTHGLIWLAQKLIIITEKILCVNRLKDKHFGQIVKGANWFSITESFAKYVVSREKEIKKYFRSGRSADEIFVQTILYDSPFKANLSDENFQNLRYVRWQKRNSPEYLTMDPDYELILKSNAMFARKFSEKVDNIIIERIQREVREK